MHFGNSMIFKLLLNDNLIGKYLLFKPTGEGGEYQNLTPFFQHIGIAHHVSCPHTLTKWLS
jgi:hypothetical protein